MSESNEEKSEKQTGCLLMQSIGHMKRVSVDNRYCLRCHRRLKDEVSRQRGYGDVCWEKIIRHNKKLF